MTLKRGMPFFFATSAATSAMWSARRHSAMTIVQYRRVSYSYPQTVILPADRLSIGRITNNADRALITTHVPRSDDLSLCQAAWPVFSQSSLHSQRPVRLPPFLGPDGQTCDHAVHGADCLIENNEMPPPGPGGRLVARNGSEILRINDCGPGVTCNCSLND
jgi:hypothetical protein